MDNKENKSELEKTREYARNEWRKYHPEEQQHPAGKNDGKSADTDNETSALGVFLTLIAFVVIGIWIGEFADEEIPILVLPICTSLYGALSVTYIKTSEKKNGTVGTLGVILATFYVIESGILSIIAFAIGGDYENGMDIVAVFNLVLPNTFVPWMLRNQQ